MEQSRLPLLDPEEVGGHAMPSHTAQRWPCSLQNRSGFLSLEPGGSCKICFVRFSNYKWHDMRNHKSCSITVCVELFFSS